MKKEIKTPEKEAAEIFNHILEIVGDKEMAKELAIYQVIKIRTSLDFKYEHVFNFRLKNVRKNIYKKVRENFLFEIKHNYFWSKVASIIRSY